jgi:xanthine dehydrogenase accessory factor
MKIGDMDPRLDPELCRLVSDKSLAVAGGVLEAVMSHLKDNGA